MTWRTNLRKPSNRLRPKSSPKSDAPGLPGFGLAGRLTRLPGKKCCLTQRKSFPPPCLAMVDGRFALVFTWRAKNALFLRPKHRRWLTPARKQGASVNLRPAAAEKCPAHDNHRRQTRSELPKTRPAFFSSRREREEYAIVLHYCQQYHYILWSTALRPTTGSGCPSLGPRFARAFAWGQQAKRLANRGFRRWRGSINCQPRHLQS